MSVHKKGNRCVFDVFTCFPSHNLILKKYNIDCNTFIFSLSQIFFNCYHSIIKVCFHIFVIISMFPESGDSESQFVYSACLSYAFIHMAFICYNLTMYFTKTQIDNWRPQRLSPGYVLFLCTDVRSKAPIRYRLMGWHISQCANTQNRSWNIEQSSQDKCRYFTLFLGFQEINQIDLKETALLVIIVTSNVATYQSRFLS